MLGRIFILVLLTVVSIGCSTTEAGVGSSQPVGTSSAPGSSTADERSDLTPEPIAQASQESPVRAELAAPDAPTAAAATPATQQSTPAPVPIDSSGIPLEDVMIPRDGLRLVFDVAASGGAGDQGGVPAAFSLILQPSRSARADISIHAPGHEGYLIMEETDTLWRAALAVADASLTRALSRVAYPRFLPTGEQQFRSVGTDRGFLVSAADGGAWEIAYDSGATARIGRFEVEPAAQDGGGPETIRVSISDGNAVNLTLRSAAVYREREITGAVVSSFGRPLSGVTVAPHPHVGRLPASRVAVTDSVGAFTLPFRAAPGDSIRLFFGRTSGSGTEERIVSPEEIRGRVGSPDFATLIFTAP